MRQSNLFSLKSPLFAIMSGCTITMNTINVHYSYKGGVKPCEKCEARTTDESELRFRMRLRMLQSIHTSGDVRHNLRLVVQSSTVHTDKPQSATKCKFHLLISLSWM